MKKVISTALLMILLTVPSFSEESDKLIKETYKLQGQVETLSKMAKVGLEVSKSYPSIYREITAPQKPIKRNDYFNGNSK